MERKICTHCNIEKDLEFFYKKYTKCKDCKTKRRLKRYYENKDKLSNQRKTFYEKDRDKLSQTQNKRCIRYKEILRSHVDL